MVIIRNNLDEVPDGKRKRLRPGKLSPRRLVPNHIKRPPYVKTRTAPGIASGPEVHDLKGIEHMRASGRLAAQVLNYAGTLVKVIQIAPPLDLFFSFFFPFHKILYSLSCFHGTDQPYNLLFVSVSVFFP